MTNQRDETMTENDTNKASQVVSSHSNISNEIHTTNVMIFYSFYVFFDFLKELVGAIINWIWRKICKNAMSSLINIKTTHIRILSRI